MDNNILIASEKIKNSDAIFLGASNGLSIAEGYNIFADNEMFRRQFGDFQRKFGIRNVLDGCFFKYPSENDRSDFLKSLVRHWVLDYKASQVMLDLLKIVSNKDYFVVTSNCDTHLELSGFKPENIFEIEGTFERWLHNLPVDNKNDELSAFVNKYHSAKLVFIELGIGSHNQLIKEPMMRLCSQLVNSYYIVMNLPKEIYIPHSISERSLPIGGDLSITLRELANACS